MISEGALQFWELLSYVVTVLGLPLALYAFWREMRAERENEQKELEQREDEIYVQLSQQYSAFLENVLAHPGLDLLNEQAQPKDLSAEQRARKAVYYEMLLALFERAYILLYEEGPNPAAGRRWGSWADFLADWLRRPDFRSYVLNNLEGEDPGFAAYVRAQMPNAERGPRTPPSTEAGEHARGEPPAAQPERDRT